MTDVHAPIVLVEDDADIREDLTELLRAERYEVVAAANGREALDVLRALHANGRTPCVVFLDLMMPVMDGWTMRREMLADPALSDLTVLVVSGAADVPGEARARGAAGYLVKPFQWKELVDAVRRHC
ncbi:MAG: response regulator [Myxococcales bacterium]|nr:response regulator [Myxococcales bacterium]